jgi:hypothetical protein
MRDARTLAPFVLLICAAGVLIYGTLTWGHDWGGDFASYIMQARSLTEGAPRDFIEANRFAMEESSYPLGPVAYPWGFPALLAPFYAVFGLDMMGLKLPCALSYLLFLVLLWFGFRRVHSSAWFLLLVGLFALNPFMLGFTNNILSDLTFLLFSTLAIVLIERAVVEGRRFISPLWDYALIGVVIMAAFFLRTIGLFLLASLALAQVVSYVQLRGKGAGAGERAEHPGSVRGLFPPQESSGKRLLIHLVPYAIFLVAALIWQLALPEGGKYQLSMMGGLSVVSLRGQIRYYLDLPQEFFTGVPHGMLIYGASIPLAVAGMMRRYRSSYPAIAYMALTMGLCLILPWRQGIRYLFPLLPFYFSFAISGMEGFQGGRSALERAVRGLACYVPVALVILFFGLSSGRAAYRNVRNERQTSFGPYAPASAAMFSFISQNTGPDDTIVFFKPRVMRLMTGRRSIAIAHLSQLSRGDYLCWYPIRAGYNELGEAAVSALVRDAGVRLVYENDDFKVYRLLGLERGAP